MSECRNDINYAAIEMFREGVTGEALYRFYRDGARRSAESHARGDTDAEKIARLQFELGMLGYDLRRVCLMLEEACADPRNMQEKEE